jgi:hypothetical protein
VSPPLTYAEWCKRHGCTHGHCVADCPKPQPVMVDGRPVCGRCLAYEGVLRDVVPCTPEVCD